MDKKVSEWLEKLGLGQYVSSFTENDIDAQLLTQLTDPDLKEIGIKSLGHRKKILAAIEALDKQEPDTAAPLTPRGEAERRQLTVMFCDLAGSTELSQRLDPEDLREINRAYQDTCKTAIERYEGYIARYMGDGVLAYFGFPQAHEDDAERAVHAGLAVVESIRALEIPRGIDQEIELAVRVGIATGPVVVGDLIGEAASQESAVVGDTPNLATRLQSLASVNEVLISPGTYEIVPGRFEFENRGEHKLKGFAEPVQCWRAVSPVAAESRFEATRQSGLTPLVGRQHEIGMLLERWEQAKEGDGQVVFLCGEAGIGKSRITETLRERTAADDPMSLRYQCSPYHSNSVMYPIIEQLERAAKIDAGDAAEIKLDKLELLLAPSGPGVDLVVPLIAHLLSIPAENRHALPPMTPERIKEKTLEVLVAQFEQLGRNRPLLLIFEDAHWADPTSLEWLELVIDRAQSVPAVVVITYRPEFQPPWSGYTHVTSLTLNRFSHSLVTAMVDRVTGGIPLPAEVLEQIVTRTDGVPLFVEELTKTILESGLLTEEFDQYALTGPLREVAIPATLQDSLMARLDRLGPVKEVAQIAAAIGREFSYDLLAAVSPLGASGLRISLDKLIDAELVFRRGHAEDGDYIFKHALVQDAAYQSLLKSARLQLHARIAETLEQHYREITAVQPEIVAHHYSEAGLAEPAIVNWLKAGNQAAGRYAHPEAIAYLRLGLAQVAEVDEPEKRNAMELDLQAALGFSLPAIRGFAAAEVGDVYTRAEQLCIATGNRSALSDALTGLWYHHVVRGEVKRAQEIASRCLDLADEDQDPARMLVAHLALGGTTWFGDFVAGREHIDKAMSFETGITDDVNLSIGANAAVFARSFGSHAHWHVGNFKRAAELSDDSIARARQLEDPFSLAIALDYCAMQHQFENNASTTRELTEEAIEICTEHQFAYYLAWARILHGWSCIRVGENGTGLAEMRTGLEDFEATGAGLRLPYYLSLIAEGESRNGQPGKALTIVDLALQRANANGEKWHNADLFRLKAQILLHSNSAEPGAAETAFQAALGIARQQGCKARELQICTELGRLWQSRGKQREAQDLVAPVYACFIDSSNSLYVKNARALLEDFS